MKTFFRELVLIMCLVSGIVFGTQAQQVPGAIKYQAVLRDVNGKTLANKENVNLRISLRLDDPTTGQITYSEEHKGITTNAYGVINLEIGGGTVTSGKDLHEVPWAQHDIYVQIEIETDGTGYTHMGNAELLTVPYAFYAENTGTDKLYENLDNNVLPKYNAANKTLVNSGVSQQGRALEMDASSITFINKADANMSGYKFPMTVGRRGQVLGFTDNAGTLDWVNVEGGAGGGNVNLNLKGDGHLVYWNDTEGELDTVSGLRYDYKAARKLELNTDITGTNNVLVSDKLGDGQIWVGDNFSNRLNPVNMSGAVLMDKTGKTRLNLAMKGGIQLIPGRNGARDTLAVDTTGFGGGSGSGGGESLWTMDVDEDYPYDPAYLYPKGDNNHDIDNVYVGIGLKRPQHLLHVYGGGGWTNQTAMFSDCEVEFTGKTQNDMSDPSVKCTPDFVWDPEKISLFVGATTFGSLPGLMDKTPPLGNYAFAAGLDASAAGNYSFALGAGSSAVPDYTFALGQGASVANNAADAFAVGNNSSVSKSNAVALGRAAKGDGSNSVALGYNAVASGNNSVVLGHGQYADANAVLVGYSNGSDNSKISSAVVVGTDNHINGTGSIVMGIGNKIAGNNSIVIGSGIDNMPTGSLIVGRVGQGMQFNGATMFGHVDYTNGTYQNTVSVGQNILYGDVNGSKVNFAGCNMLGTNLSNYDKRELTMIGSELTADMNLSGNPVFMYGRNFECYFEIDRNGDAHLKQGGQIMTFSDERLKTDIKPMLWTPDLLDLITPVSYSFKSDEQQNTHFGFIAQEVRKVFPELVREGNKGMLSLDYIGLIPVLWQINQNLSHKVNDLEQRLEEQSRKQAELESELQAIKAKLGM